MLVCSATLLVVSLLLPWFSGHIASRSVEFYGYHFPFVLSCTAVVGVTIGLGVWRSWIGRTRFVVWLSLAVSVATVFFAGFTLTLSLSLISLSRLVSIVGLGDVVGIRVRAGIPALLLSGMFGMAGSATILARWGFRSVAAVGFAPLGKPRSDDPLGSLPDENALDRGGSVPTVWDEEDGW